MRSHEWPELLLDLRLETGLSIRKLADQIGIQRHTIKRAETGQKITVETLERMLHAYGYELEALKVERPEDAV